MCLFVTKATQITKVRNDILRRGYTKISFQAKKLDALVLSCYLIAAAFAILTILFVNI